MKYKEIKIALYNLNQKINKSIANHNTRMKAFEKERTYIQEQCDHKWKYLPDPSGDSEYVCEVCELYSKKPI